MCVLQKSTLFGRFETEPNTRRWDCEFTEKWYQNETENPEFLFLGCAVIDMPDFDIRPYFEETTAFLTRCQKEERKVLVHCIQGINRSSCVAVRYLAHAGRAGGNIGEVINAVSQQRQCILSNRSFVNSLLIDAEERGDAVDNTQCSEETRDVRPEAPFVFGDIVEKNI